MGLLSRGGWRCRCRVVLDCPALAGGHRTVVTVAAMLVRAEMGGL